MNNKIFNMNAGKVIALLINKCERKSKSSDEVYELIEFLLGYTKKDLISIMQEDISYKQLFDEAPCLNPIYRTMTGTICGIKIQEIEDDTMKKIRCLDKLVDELAKGKSVEKIIDKYK